MVCSPPGSCVHGISQARILKQIATSFSRWSSWPRDWTHISCTGRWILYHWATREAQPTVVAYKYSFVLCPFPLTLVGWYIFTETQKQSPMSEMSWVLWQVKWVLALYTLCGSRYRQRGGWQRSKQKKQVTGRTIRKGAVWCVEVAPSSLGRWQVGWGLSDAGEQQRPGLRVTGVWEQEVRGHAVHGAGHLSPGRVSLVSVNLEGLRPKDFFPLDLTPAWHCPHMVLFMWLHGWDTWGPFHIPPVSSHHWIMLPHSNT